MLVHSNSSLQKVSKDLMGSPKFVRQMPKGRDPSVFHTHRSLNNLLSMHQRTNEARGWGMVNPHNVAGK